MNDANSYFWMNLDNFDIFFNVVERQIHIQRVTIANLLKSPFCPVSLSNDCKTFIFMDLYIKGFIKSSIIEIAKVSQTYVL